MVLEHDTLSKYLHIPDSCGRFNFVFCRQAQLALQTLLQSWSTFVLVENTAYVKYLYEWVYLYLFLYTRYIYMREIYLSNVCVYMKWSESIYWYVVIMVIIVNKWSIQ